MGPQIVPRGWDIKSWDAFQTSSPFSGNPGLEQHRGSCLGKCCARHLVSIIFNLHRILAKHLLFSHGDYKSQRMRLVSDKASLPEDGNEVQLTLKWQSYCPSRTSYHKCHSCFPRGTLPANNEHQMVLKVCLKRYIFYLCISTILKCK